MKEKSCFHIIIIRIEIVIPIPWSGDVQNGIGTIFSASSISEGSFKKGFIIKTNIGT